MKKLLNTLYVLTENRYLSLDGENVVVKENGEEVSRIPLHNLESIVAFGYLGASPALMGECAKMGVSLCFLTMNGRFLSRVSGEINGNVILRTNQFRCANDKKSSLEVAKNMIVGKLFNSRWVIERATRDYAMRLDCEKLKSVSNLIKKNISFAQECENIELLRGIEGESAKMYFSVFDDLILQQKDDFKFSTRSRRPPLDFVNALLSFSYTLLTSCVVSALESVGLDAYVGFMHTLRPGRASLALDLVEELRSVFADRFVLSLINKRIVNKTDFIVKENGAIVLTLESKKKFISAWQTKKHDIITHPFLQEKIEWGLVPFAQAMLLSRYLRGDLDAYPPFLWK